MPAPKAILWLRRRFITGFFVAVPLIISVAAILWVFYLIDDLSGPVYDRFLGRHVAGLGLATTVAFVLLVGVVASNVLGKRLLSRVEGYLARIPVFRTVYSPVKQLLTAFSPDNESGLKRVVMVQDPGYKNGPTFVVRGGFPFVRRFQFSPPRPGTQHALSNILQSGSRPSTIEHVRSRRAA